MYRTFFLKGTALPARRAEWQVAVVVNEEAVGTKDRSDKVLVIKIFVASKIDLSFYNSLLIVLKHSLF